MFETVRNRQQFDLTWLCLRSRRAKKFSGPPIIFTICIFHSFSLFTIQKRHLLGSLPHFQTPTIHLFLAPRISLIHRLHPWACFRPRAKCAVEDFGTTKRWMAVEGDLPQWGDARPTVDLYSLYIVIYIYYYIYIYSYRISYNIR